MREETAMPKGKKPRIQHQHQPERQAPVATPPGAAPTAAPTAASPASSASDTLLRQTREQRYAADVYERLTTFLRDPKTDKETCKKYRSIVLSAPALIRNAGLAQALVFLATREATQSRLVDDLAAIVLGQDKQGKPATADALLKQSRGGPSSTLTEYMLLTRQTLDALLWLRRYVQHHIANDGGIQHLDMSAPTVQVL
jgi:CRISPR/Cas system CMR-associated protein Cmr5 small subunit